MKFDAVQFGKSIGAMLKEQVAPLREENAKLLAANAALLSRLDALEKSIDARLAAVTMKDAVIDRAGCLVLTFGDGSTKNMGAVVGKDADAAEIKAHVAAQVLKDIPQPTDGARLTAEDFRHMVADLVVNEVKTAVSGLPQPKEFDPVALQASIEAAVQKAVAALPKPPEPRPFEPESVRHIIGELVGEAFKALPVPKDGKDVDIAALQSAIDAAVQKAVAALPKPPEPKPFEPESVRHIVGELVGEAFKALPVPKDGKDVDAAALQSAIDAAVQKAVAALPKPTEPKGFEPESVRHILAELVTNEIKQLPPPKDGEDVDPVALQASIEAAVQKAVAALPKPTEPKGFEPESVRHIIGELVVDEVTKGLDSIRLPDPEPGISDAAINDKGELVLTRTDGKMLVPGRVKGDDAFRLEDLELAPEDGGRRITYRFSANGRQVERTIKTATVIDRGVWKPGQYEAGDAVTTKGSWWVATRDTDGRPGDPDSGWRLAVKRGRDGKPPGQGGRS